MVTADQAVSKLSELDTVLQKGQSEKRLIGAARLREWIAKTHLALALNDLGDPSIRRGASAESLMSQFGYRRKQVGPAYLLPVLVAWSVLWYVEFLYENSGTTDNLFVWWASDGVVGLGPSSFSLAILLAVILVLIGVLRVSRWNRTTDVLRYSINACIQEVAGELSALLAESPDRPTMLVLQELRQLQTVPPPSVMTPEDTRALGESMDSLSTRLESLPGVIARLEQSLRPFPGLAASMEQTSMSLTGAMETQAAFTVQLAASAAVLSQMGGATAELHGAIGVLDQGLERATATWKAATDDLATRLRDLDQQQAATAEVLAGVRELYAAIVDSFARMTEVERRSGEILSLANLTLKTADNLQRDHG